MVLKIQSCKSRRRFKYFEEEEEEAMFQVQVTFIDKFCYSSPLSGTPYFQFEYPQLLCNELSGPAGAFAAVIRVAVTLTSVLQLQSVFIGDYSTWKEIADLRLAQIALELISPADT